MSDKTELQTEVGATHGLSSTEGAMLQRLVMCMNPHWRDKLPAWDIRLTNGEIHKSVTQKEISVVLGKMYRLGKIGLYDSYIDVVRGCHIDNYNRFFTCT